MSIHFYARKGNLDEVSLLIHSGVKVNTRERYTQHTPLLCAALSPEAGVDMLKFLVEWGANLNAPAEGGKETILSCAIKSGSVEKVSYLLSQGCDLHYQKKGGYDALIDAAFCANPKENLVPLLDFLIGQGVSVNSSSDYGESAVTVSSRLGHFDALQVLLTAGADQSALYWDELMNAIAFGTFSEIRELIETGSSLEVRDHQGRSPWLLSLHVGNLAKAKMLLAFGAPQNDVACSGTPPLFYAIEAGHLKMVDWLISIGCDINKGNDFYDTPLTLAAERGETKIVRWLLNQGADPKRQTTTHKSAMSLAENLEIAQLLAAAGENLQDLNETRRAELTGIGEHPLLITPEEYKAGRARWFGKTNPEVMEVAFWQAMVRCRKPAYEAQAAFSKVEQPTQPVWCYDRFGQTLTCLPDGRIIEIGGEHEDFYDPDFCIYNDVVVYDKEGQFKIFGYPSVVFPPTDFHSATLVGNVVYIIGCLGYKDDRHYGETPVYQLDCETLEIERVKTAGHKPGWISRHHAQYLAPNQIVISGGKIDRIIDGKPSYVDHEGAYSLDLTTLKWRRESTRLR